MAQASRNVDPSLERHFTGHRAGITKVRFSPDCDILATSSADCSVILWDLKQAARCLRCDAHTKTVSDISWSPKDNLVASASQDQTVKIWQPKVHGASSEFVAHNAAVTSVDFNCSGFTLVTGSVDKTIKLWNVGTRRFLSTITAHTGIVNCTRFSADGKLLASCGEDRTLRIFDPRTGECTRQIGPSRNIDASPLQLAWHPTGKLIALALASGRIRIFDITDGNLIQLYLVHSAAVNDVAFHPSGNFIISASDDKTVKVLDLLEGRPIYTLTGHSNAVKSVHFSNDGKLFASAGEDKQLLVWRSELHDFDAEVFKKTQEEKMSANNSATDRSAQDDEIMNNSTIWIDPRQSAEFVCNDENQQVQADKFQSITLTTLEPNTTSKSPLKNTN